MRSSTRDLFLVAVILAGAIESGWRAGESSGPGGDPGSAPAMRAAAAPEAPAAQGRSATSEMKSPKGAASQGEKKPAKEKAVPADPRLVATKLRGMYYARDFEGAVAEGRRVIGLFPGPDEARAWYLLSLAAIFGEEDAAIAEAEKWVASRPEDPWARFALAGTLSEEYDRFPEALPESRKAFRMAKNHPDFIYLRASLLSDSGRTQDALDLIDRSLPRAGNPADLLALKGDVLLRTARSAKGNSQEAIREGALKLFEKAREADPANVYAQYRPGVILTNERRIPEALPLLRRAAELSPFSTGIHNALWNAILGQTDVAPEKKQAGVETDIRALLRARGDYPGALLAASVQYGEMGRKERQKEIDTLILKKFSESPQAEWVLVNRWRSFAEEHPGEELKEPKVKAEAVRMYQEFIRRPKHLQEDLLGEAYIGLFTILKDDPGTGGDELLEPIRGMLEHEKLNLGITYPAAACALADRKAHLDEAERILERGFEAARREGAGDHAYRYESRKEQKEWVRYLDALLLDASGWVHLNQGRMEEAEAELSRAQKILKESEVNLHHLGRLAEAKGDLDGAEKWYARGMAVQTPRENPCAQDLKDLYLKRFGSLEGFDAYAERFKSADRGKRKETVLAGRIAAPEAIQNFSLNSLDGARISAEGLKGKILVVNFWGVWCGWCLEEMPEIQKLYEKYRNDPEVVILTIDNDPNPETVREFMKKKGFTFPVLLDDGYVAGKAQVYAFPTTWFVDREGRKAFVRDGWSKELVEEYGWRIDALLGAPPG